MGTTRPSPAHNLSSFPGAVVIHRALTSFPGADVIPLALSSFPRQRESRVVKPLDSCCAGMTEDGAALYVQSPLNRVGRLAPRDRDAAFCAATLRGGRETALRLHSHPRDEWQRPCMSLVIANVDMLRFPRIG